MSGMPVMPVAVLFFQSNGLSITEIFILQAVYAFTIFILEIPSGYLADRLGYRVALLLSAFFTFVGMLIFIFLPSVLWLLIAEIVLGIGLSLYSGVPSSLLYELAQKYNYTNEYIRFDAYQIGIASIFGAIGVLFSGLLAAYSLFVPFIVAALLSLSACLCALYLPNVYTDKSQDSKHNIVELSKEIYKIIYLNKKVLGVIIYSTILLAGLNILNWIQQLYMIDIHLDVRFFGVLGFLVGISVMLFSNKLVYIRKHLDFRLIAIITIIMIVLAFMSIAIDIGIAALALMYVAYLMSIFVGSVFRNIVHSNTQSKIRATVLSVKNMISKILYIMAMSVLGYILDILSLQTVSIIISIFITVVSFMAVWLMRGSKINTSTYGKKF